MKKTVYLLLIISFILSGCATSAKLPVLKNSLSPESVRQLWGNPAETIRVGTTSEDYPVEVWEYSFKKDTESWALIFVDSELFFWAKNDPEKIFEQLINLGVYDEKEVELMERQEFLNNSATQAEETRKTMDMIRTYKLFENIQMQMQTQQIMQTIQRQQPRMPPQMPPQPPVRLPTRQ